MTDDTTAYLMARWRTQLLNDRVEGAHALQALAETDYPQFRTICASLSRDANEQVAILALRQLGFAGAYNDAEADALVRERLTQGDPKLRDAALLALGRVGVPESFPLLLNAAREGSYIALYGAERLARRLGQPEPVITLARQLARSSDGKLRGEALRALRGFSTAEREEQLLLEVAAEYLDDDAFMALQRASPRALPRLEAIRASLMPGSVQWEEATKAINQIREQHR